MTFTADNLPEAARVSDDDVAELMQIWPASVAGNRHTARVLNRLDAAHNGRLSALLNGTAPVATDQPPEVTADDVLAVRPFFKDGAGILDVILLMLKDDRARVWQTHRPAADPVRFALEKVTQEAWGRVWELSKTVVSSTNRVERFEAISELAKILPVAKSVKPLAELTDEALIDAFHKANAAYGSNMPAGVYEFDKDRYEASLKLAAASLRASLSAYAPPPRKVDVTPEVMKAFTEAWCALNEQNGQTFTNEPGYENLSRPIMTAHLYSFRAALAVANTQANARESEAVAEVERLKGEVERLKHEFDGLLTESEGYRDKYKPLQEESIDLQTHAAALEALLTVRGVDGPVKTWEAFDINPGYGWKRGDVVLAATFGGRATAWLFDRFLSVETLDAPQIRQTPAPELKRWKIAAHDESAFEYSVTEPMTRADAESLGEVIGEA